MEGSRPVVFIELPPNKEGDILKGVKVDPFTIEGDEKTSIEDLVSRMQEKMPERRDWMRFSIVPRNGSLQCERTGKSAVLLPVINIANRIYLNVKVRGGIPQGPSSSCTLPDQRSLYFIEEILSRGSWKWQDTCRGKVTSRCHRILEILQEHLPPFQGVRVVARDRKQVHGEGVLKVRPFESKEFPFKFRWGSHISPDKGQESIPIEERRACVIYVELPPENKEPLMSAKDNCWVDITDEVTSPFTANDVHLIAQRILGKLQKENLEERYGEQKILEYLCMATQACIGSPGIVLSVLRRMRILS